MQRIKGGRTSSSIVTTRPDGARPALHLRGATADFYVDDALMEKVVDAKVVHIGGVGLMDRMDDSGRNGELLKRAKAKGATTTVDVFAGSPDDMGDVAGVLPFTDYFMPSIEEARALTGLTDAGDVARKFLDLGVNCCVLTLGADGAYYHHRDGTRFTVPAYADQGEMHLRMRRRVQCRLCRRPRQGVRSRNHRAVRPGDLGAQRHRPRVAGRRPVCSSTRSLS